MKLTSIIEHAIPNWWILSKILELYSEFQIALPCITATPHFILKIKMRERERERERTLSMYKKFDKK